MMDRIVYIDEASRFDATANPSVISVIMRAGRDRGVYLDDPIDISAMWTTPQIHTSDDGVHTDDDGHVYDAVTVDGELTFVPQEPPTT